MQVTAVEILLIFVNMQTDFVHITHLVDNIDKLHIDINKYYNDIILNVDLNKYNYVDILIMFRECQLTEVCQH